jgi:hypothetical protein
MADTETTTLAMRNQVIALARSLRGSHYTQGAAGDIPDRGGGAEYRRSTMRMLPNEPFGHLVIAPGPSPARPASHRSGPPPVMFAAQCDQMHQKICRGRPEADDVQAKPIATLDNQSAETTPDNYRWPRPTDFFSGRKIFGESCANKRHFDCIGFVNYCLGAVTRRSVHFDIVVWDRRALRRLLLPHEQSSRATIITDPRGIEGHAADLVLQGAHHIGLLTGDNYVIQAQGELRGVMQEHYSPRAWTTLVRLPRGWWPRS